MGDLSGVCSICGKKLASTTCVLCGALVCEQCSKQGVCDRCKRGRTGKGPPPGTMR